MRTRGAAALLMLSVLAAACGTSGPEAGPGVVMRYSYQPGDALAYDLDAALDLDMTASGNSAAAAGMEASMVMSVNARLDLGFALGPTPDTIEITVSEELLEGGARMTSMGEEVLIPLDELAAEMEQEIVIVVDPQGRPVSATVGGLALPAQFLAGTSAFGGSLLTPQQFGPEFPETGLAVGAEWDTQQSAEVFGMAFTQHGQHRVVAREELESRTVLRIDSQITTGAIHIGLADLMEALGRAPGLLGEADPAELEAGMAQFESMGVTVEITMEESTTTMTTWFDPAAGLVVRSAIETPMTMRMAMRGLPGGDVEVVMEMTTDQRLTLAA
jgi:hypothetical protein